MTCNWAFTERSKSDYLLVFGIHPGRCLIGVDVTLPQGTVLAEPLTDDCVWRQGRGSLVELSIFDGELMTQKVSSGSLKRSELIF